MTPSISTNPAREAASLARFIAAHPRLFVLTDIGNEPDDQMSLVRLLLYSNEIDIEGIGATTSVWQRDKVQPQLAQASAGAVAVIAVMATTTGSIFMMVTLKGAPAVR